MNGLLRGLLLIAQAGIGLHQHGNKYEAEHRAGDPVYRQLQEDAEVRERIGRWLDDTHKAWAPAARKLYEAQRSELIEQHFAEFQADSAAGIVKKYPWQSPFYL